jgi:hypothetical protein
VVKLLVLVVKLLHLELHVDQVLESSRNVGLGGSTLGGIVVRKRGVKETCNHVDGRIRIHHHGSFVLA